MPMFPVELDAPPLPDIWVPPVPEVVDIPADLPTLEPSVVVTLPLNEEVTDALIVPGELSGGDGTDVLYVAISQERVNVWAAVVYFVPEIALGLTALLILVALRKLWVGRRFTHRKGEAYCKKCWAGLTGIESDTCPECGRAVAKTRRVAKRSRRSPLSVRGLLVAATVGMSMITGTLWFGESWRGVYSKGFDWRASDDWRRLVDPLDRRSPFRINKIAGWFDWPSAKLAAFARDRNHLWLSDIETAYRDGEGILYRNLVRRYATSDGSKLSEHLLPASSQWQDSYEHGGAWLVYKADTLFVSDGDHYYCLRPDANTPWLKYETENPDEFFSFAGITPDGNHLVIGLNGLDAGWHSLTASQRFVVFETQTGEMLSVLDPLALDDRYPVLGIETELIDLVMMEDVGVVLLCLEQRHPVTGDTEQVVMAWDFLNETLSPVEPVSIPPAAFYFDTLLEFGYPWSIKSIDSKPNSIFETSRIMRNVYRQTRFEIWRSESQRAGDVLGWLPDELNRSSYSSLHQPTVLPPYDWLNPDTDIPLYDLSSARLPSRPDRALRISPALGRALFDVQLAPSGHSAVIDMLGNSQIYLLNIDTAMAMASFPMDRSMEVDHKFFVNEETQYIMCVDRNLRQNAAAVPKYRSEILIFDLPE
ncbi:hypothetical protein OT109_03870 [Phycisphaeraceae bacterium D3-23]